MDNNRFRFRSYLKLPWRRGEEGKWSVINSVNFVNNSLT